MAEANPGRTIYAFEPNLNSLYYLGYRTAKYKNVVIVPGPLTAEAKITATTYDPNFVNPPTGPQAVAFPVEEAIRWFGVPAFVKLDCEGFEYELLERCAPLLKNSTLPGGMASHRLGRQTQPNGLQIQARPVLLARHRCLAEPSIA